MRPSRIAYLFLGTFLAFVFTLQWWQSASYPLSIWIGIGVIFVIGLVLRKNIFGTSVLTVSLAMLIALLGVMRVTHVETPQTIDAYADGSKVWIAGVIDDMPDRRPLTSRYSVATQKVKTGGKTITVSGRVLVTVQAGVTRVEYGEHVLVQGKLERPHNENGFAYDNYLSRIDTYAIMKANALVSQGKNDGWMGLRWLYTLREGLEERVNALFPEPHASLLSGLLLGSRRGIPDDLTEDFKTTGLTHLIAISGFNITMLVTVIGALLFFVPVRHRFIPSLLLIVGFTLLTGATASAVRAAIMGILGLIALQTGRTATTRLSMLWSAFFMLAWNPKLLWYDAGFQLSFLALVGVVELSPLLKPYFAWLPETCGIRESLCLTVSAQLLASSWILFLFGQLSLIAPLSNLLAPPIVPYAMLLGTLTLIVSVLGYGIGQLFAALTWIPLQMILACTHLLARVPFAAVDLGAFSTMWIVFYYVGLTAWTLWRHHQMYRRSVCLP